MTSTGDDVHALPDHLRRVRTNIEVVAYRQGNNPMLLFNRGGRCVYREQLEGGFDGDDGCPCWRL